MRCIGITLGAALESMTSNRATTANPHTSATTFVRSLIKGSFCCCFSANRTAKQGVLYSQFLSCAWKNLSVLCCAGKICKHSAAVCWQKISFAPLAATR